MLGWKKNYAIKVLIFLPVLSFAFIPQSGQIFRFQPNVLRSEKPFQSKGTLSVAGTSLPYLLKWYGPSRYEVTVSNVGKAFSSKELSAPVTWTLVRHKELCAIKTFVMTVACPSTASLWGSLELSAQSDIIAKALLNAGIYSAADLPWNETDSRQAEPANQKNRTRLRVGENGSAPIAVLEIRGEEFKGDEPGLERPLIQFDQTFLAPVLLRYEQNSQVLTLKATSDLEVKRDHTRFSPVMANKLEYFEGSAKKATLTRKDPEPLLASTPAKVPSTATNAEALQAELSTQGQELYRALITIH